MKKALKKVLPRRRLILGGSLAALVIVTVAGLMLFLQVSSQQLARQQAADHAQLQKIDKTIAQLKAERAKRIAAEKKAAEEKARQEAEAARQAEMAQNLKQQQAGKVVTPKGCVAADAHSDPTAISVVINKKRCFSPIDFTPPDLIETQGAILSAKAAPSFNALMQAAAAAGLPLRVTSSYRSYANQVSTYNYWVGVNGSTASADTVSARPGYSEHQTGFTVDLAAGSCSLDCFAGTPQATWMRAHAAEYGFVERYPAGLTAITGYSPEAWHYRYVGAAVAQDMQAKGIKTLEQYWNITGGDY